MVLLVVKPHSFIDVITNSSTELFVTDKDRSVEFVKELLQELLNTYNKYNDTNYSFDSVFGEIDIYDGSKFGTWYDEHAGLKKGQLYIISAEDNSIPYGIMQFIEDGMNMTRYHI